MIGSFFSRFERIAVVDSFVKTLVQLSSNGKSKSKRRGDRRGGVGKRIEQIDVAAVAKRSRGRIVEQFFVICIALIATGQLD